MSRGAAIRNLRRAHARRVEWQWSYHCAADAREAHRMLGKVSAAERALLAAQVQLARLATDQEK